MMVHNWKHKHSVYYGVQGHTEVVRLLLNDSLVDVSFIMDAVNKLDDKNESDED